ncbi:MAG: hypothetical protein HKN27_11965 [Silicimonas sp.]|nr:hypothetical protein [Silicimonas sp.]
MTVAAMSAVLAVELGVGLLTVVFVERMTEFGLMTGFIAVRHTVDHKISGRLQAREEHGDSQEYAQEGPHSVPILPQ